MKGPHKKYRSFRGHRYHTGSLNFNHVSSVPRLREQAIAGPTLNAFKQVQQRSTRLATYQRVPDKTNLCPNGRGLSTGELPYPASSERSYNTIETMRLGTDVRIISAHLRICKEGTHVTSAKEQKFAPN